MGYYDDERVQAGMRSKPRIKNEKICVTVEDENGYEIDLEIPIKWEVCPTCQGRGYHVSPGIDSHGLTAEDFASDPDFAEDYFGGKYDQTCNECDGQRVVPVADELLLPQRLLMLYHAHLDAQDRYVQQRAHELKYGY
ncbi:MAG: hypothetical protein DWQ19_12955 [Crenarchaeota archaeon]|nr:MAG: hypothetical protein DWQ19_12955 [Thermoproteota archaeon]